MSWIGPAIGAVGSLVSAFGNKGPNTGMQINAADAAFRKRVATLRELGISPLYAAGAGIQTVSPPSQTLGDVGGAISGIGSVVDQYQNASRARSENAVIRQQTVKESEARIFKDEAMGHYYNSLAAKAALDRTSSPSAPVTSPAEMMDAVKVTLVEIPSRQSAAPHVTAGSKPGFSEIEVRPGVKMLWPSSEEGFHENIESGINPAYVLAVLSANKERYGAQSAVQNTASVFGIPKWMLGPFAGESPLSESAQTRLLDAIDRVVAGYKRAKNRQRVIQRR